MINIKTICDNALCTGCGACSGICPTSAISMVTNDAGFIVASVDDSMCIKCSKCYNVCPSAINNIKNNKSKDFFKGNYICGYIGYAINDGIRKNSQSGGIVTALLCYMIEKNIIKGAVVNQFDSKAMRPRAIFARNKEEIIKSSGSYYTQTSVVKTILEECKDKDIAAVTLGCQSESLKLIKEKYPNTILPSYIIGLVCAGQNSGYMIDDLINEAGIDVNNERVGKFRFRDKNAGGWPGNISIWTESKKYSLDKVKRHNLKPIYELYRCLLCFDQMNIYSDIVCGDPWNIEGKQTPEGHTIVIARTEKGKRLLEKAMNDGAIFLELLPAKDIFDGQTIDSQRKPNFFSAREFCKEKGWSIPYNDINSNDNTFYREKKRKYLNLNKRLKYTKKLYTTKNIKKVKKLIRHKKYSKNMELILTNTKDIAKKYVKGFLKELQKNK